MNRDPSKGSIRFTADIRQEMLYPSKTSNILVRSDKAFAEQAWHRQGQSFPQ
jgi:hypothetical protein